MRLLLNKYRVIHKKRNIQSDERMLHKHKDLKTIFVNSTKQ